MTASAGWAEMDLGGHWGHRYPKTRPEPVACRGTGRSRRSRSCSHTPSGELARVCSSLVSSEQQRTRPP
jgi:hypothetical protein